MNNIQCITDSDEHRFEPSNLDHARAVEDYADNLMDECKDYNRSAYISYGNDLYDGDLLPRMMQAVALWQGSGASAISQMHALHNLLANALQEIAEREVK